MSQLPLTYTTFLEWFPEFSDVPTNVGEFRLSLSNDFLQSSVWGKLYQQASALLTAHYLFLKYNISEGLTENGMRSPASTIGITTNKSANTSGLSEGSVTNSMITSDNPIVADLARTEYGLEFLNLLYTWIPACDIVFSPDASAKYWEVQ